MKTREAMLHAWFLGSLDGDRGLRLLEELRAEDAARRNFEALLRVEHALCGLDAEQIPFTHFDVERLLPVVMRRLGLHDPSPPATAPRWRRLAFALALGAPLALALLLWWPRSVGDEGPIPAALFAPRGSEAAYRSHLFAFCVEGEGEATTVTRLDRPLLGQGARCSRRAELQLAITNQHPGLPFLHVAGFDQEGRRLWYEPGPGVDRSVSVATEVEERLLGESFRLAVHHRPGPVRVVALFSARPLAEPQLSTLLSGQKPGVPAPELPVDLGTAVVQVFDMVVGE